MKRLSRYRPRPSLKIVTPVQCVPIQCVPTGHPNHDETARLHVSRPYFRNRFQRGVYFGFPFWPTRFGTFILQTSFRVSRGCVRGPFVRLSTPSAGSHGGRTCRKRPGSGALLEHLSRVASTLHRPCPVAPAARQPGCTGRAQIRCSIAPNRRHRPKGDVPPAVEIQRRLG